jgi:hypothetical protein
LKRGLFAIELGPFSLAFFAAEIRFASTNFAGAPRELLMAALL